MKSPEEKMNEEKLAQERVEYARLQKLAEQTKQAAQLGLQVKLDTIDTSTAISGDKPQA